MRDYALFGCFESSKTTSWDNQPRGKHDACTCIGKCALVIIIASSRSEERVENVCGVKYKNLQL